MKIIKKDLLIDVDLTPETVDSFSNCFVSDDTKLIGLTWKGRNDEKFLPIHSYVNVIGAEAFINCSEPKNIFIPNWVTKIEKNAFYGLGEETKYYVFNEANKKNLLNININREQIFQVEKYFIIQDAELVGVTKAGRNSTTLTIPSNIRIIGDCAFFSCWKLENINILSSPLYGSVRHISTDAFVSCWSLKSIRLPDCLKSIGTRAFADCESLREITIPHNVSYMSSGVFDKCPNLKMLLIIPPVLFDWWVQHHDYNGQTLSKMSRIDLNKFTNSSNQPFTFIAKRSFTNRNLLQSLILSNDIKVINSSTFENCHALVNLEIPFGVKSINNWGFNNCTSLANIVIFNDSLNLSLISVHNCSPSAKFYIFSEKMQDNLIVRPQGEWKIILINHFIFDQDVLIGLTEEGKKNKQKLLFRLALLPLPAMLLMVV